MLCDSQNGNLALDASDIHFCGSSSSKKPYAIHLRFSQATQMEMWKRNKEIRTRKVLGGWSPPAPKTHNPWQESNLPTLMTVLEIQFFFSNLRALWEVKVKHKRQFLWMAWCAHVYYWMWLLHRQVSVECTQGDRSPLNGWTASRHVCPLHWRSLSSHPVKG